MKITVVTNTSWNIFNFRLPLLRELRKSGHDIYIIAPEDEYSEHLKVDFDEFHSIKISRKGYNPFKDFMFFWQLLDRYKKIRPDLTIHYTIKPNIYGSLAAFCTKVPTINNVTGLGTVFLHDNLGSKIAKLLYKISFKKSELVFFQNPTDKALFVDMGLCPKDVAGLVPGSGIDVDYFKQERLNEQKVFTFAYVGRMLFDKGIIELIEAIKAFKIIGGKAKFIFAGQLETEAGLGIDLTVMNEWVEKGIIEYAGLVSDMKEFLKGIDCVILPSYREGAPRALLEAASMSIPLIATDVPGCREVVINEENGILCKPKNANSLLEALKKMVSLPLDKRLSMGKAGRKKVVECFSNKIVISKYQTAISDLVKE